MNPFKKNDEELYDEFGEVKHRRVHIPSILTLVVVIALLVFVIIKLWNSDDTSDNIELPPLATSTPAPIDYNESEKLFAQNVEDDILYVMTSKAYKKENMKEQTLFVTLDGLRKAYGRQGEFIISRAYIDDELCSGNDSYIVYQFACKNASGVHNIEVRVSYGAMTGSNGYVDLYAVECSFAEK